MSRGEDSSAAPFGGLKFGDLFTAWQRESSRYVLDSTYFPRRANELVLCRNKYEGGILCAAIVLRGSMEKSDVVIIETRINEPFQGKRAGDLHEITVENHAFVANTLSDRKMRAFREWFDAKRTQFSRQIALHSAHLDALKKQAEIAAIRAEEEKQFQIALRKAEKEALAQQKKEEAQQKKEEAQRRKEEKEAKKQEKQKSKNKRCREMDKETTINDIKCGNVRKKAKI